MEEFWRVPFFIIWFLIAGLAFSVAGLCGLIFSYLFTGFIIWCGILGGKISPSVIILWMPAIMSERLLEKWYYD